MNIGINKIFSLGGILAGFILAFIILFTKALDGLFQGTESNAKPKRKRKMGSLLPISCNTWSVGLDSRLADNKSKVVNSFLESALCKSDAIVNISI